MRLRNWLLTGTSLGLLALAPLPAQAQSAELTSAYQAYVDAQASGDAAATEAALNTLTEQCIVAGYSSIDECIAALSAAPAAQPDADAAAAAEAEAAAQAEAERAAAEQAAAEQAAAEQAAAEQAAAEQAAAEQAAAEQAAAEQAAAEQAAAEQAAAEQAAADQAAADQAAAEQAAAEQAAAEQAQAEAEANAAAQAEADAQAATDAAAAEEQFVADLNAALGDYQAALDQAASGGDFASAQAMADDAEARILQLCTANGYADIPSCIGQELPELPQPPATEQPADQSATEQPADAGQPAAEQQTTEQPAADQPTTEQPAADQQSTEQPANAGSPEAQSPDSGPLEEPAPPEDDPQADAQATITTAIELYNSGIQQLNDGNADGQVTVDLALQQITDACATLGQNDVAACLQQFGFPPLAEVPQVQPAEQPEQNLSPAADEEVTPDAIEALPADIAPEEAAPLLDSAKDDQTQAAAPPAEGTEAPADQQQPEQQTAEQQPAPAEEGPPPASDAEAQAAIEPVEVQSVAAEEGQPIAEQAIALAPAQLAEEPLPQNVTIINNTTVNNTTVNNTVINNNAPSSPVLFQIGVNIVINNPEQERDRMYRPDEDRIFYEELRNGRTRETIVRPNGVRIVTIRNRWGDVLKRSRITPDGREFILAYYDEDRFDDRDEDDREGFFIDPGRDLPPLRLNIPARDYILDVQYADEDEVEEFFREPPVEQVRRIYSIEEVKRSARIRDSVRRVEVGGLTFDSGKATISSSQVGTLSKVAKAMLDILDENPAETFLIEGHTDAVGSDTSNLILSDQRAAVVAQILTDFYKVPPENLVTQGYGERYLKVKTQEAERLNRRVTIKRITPLITVSNR